MIYQLKGNIITGDDTSYQLIKSDVFTYTAENRIEESIITDYTVTPSSRSSTYSYLYHDTEQSQLSQMTIDGSLLGVSDATTLTYNLAGNVTSITNSLGHMKSFSNYNNQGQAQLITDINNNHTILSYHVRGWLKSVTTNDLLKLRLNYYPTGLVQKITQANGSFLTYEYNAAHHLNCRRK